MEKLERRVAHKDGPEEDSDGKKGPKQSGDDRGFLDGERLKGEVVMMDKDYKEKLEVEEHVLVPKKESVQHVCSGVREHVVAHGDGETSAHRELSKAD